LLAGSLSAQLKHAPAQKEKKKETQARTHARTPPADAAVAWAFGARAAIASCVARAAGVWVVHVDGI